eukprot:9035652-Pyramimonas_sp.AAC.1
MRRSTLFCWPILQAATLHECKHLKEAKCGRGVCWTGVASPMVGHLDGHDRRSGEVTYSKYKHVELHATDDFWRSIEEADTNNKATAVAAAVSNCEHQAADDA